MIDEQAKERLRTLTVETLLGLRAAYLATPGINALKHWDQMQDRARAAARTCGSPEEWVTKVARDLQLPAFSVGTAESAVALVHEVTEQSARNAWLDLVEDELGYLFALCRLESERRKEQRAEAYGTEPTKPKTERKPRSKKQGTLKGLLDHGN